MVQGSLSAAAHDYVVLTVSPDRGREAVITECDLDMGAGVITFTSGCCLHDHAVAGRSKQNI